MVDIARDPRFRPVLYVLIKHKECPISQSEIAEQSSYSLATVKRHLKTLKMLKVVEWQGGHIGGATTYQVDKTIERLVVAN